MAPVKWFAIFVLGVCSTSALAQSEAPFDPNKKARSTVGRLDWSRLGPIQTSTGPFHRTAKTAPVILEPIYRPRLVQPSWSEASLRLAPASLFTPSPHHLDRDMLEGLGEAFQPFSEVPGGIVLGRAATLEDLPREGVTLAAQPQLALSTQDGRRFALPPVAPSLLADALAFVTNPRGADSLIDMHGDRVAWLAPEIRDPHHIELLRRVDRTPRRTIPGSHGYKALIVDDSVRIVPDHEALTLRIEADLDVRFYAAASSGYVQNALWRVAAHRFHDGTLGMEPRTAMPAGTLEPQLTAALAELAPLARWIGFLRWLRVTDPRGFAALRSRVEPAGAGAAGLR